MRRIASEENAPRTIAIGDDIARLPPYHRKDLVRHVLADHLAEVPLGVNLVGRVVERFAVEAEAVELATVEVDVVAPQPLRVDEPAERGLALRVVRPQLRCAHEHRYEIPHMGRAPHADAKLPPDWRVPAAAIDHDGRRDLDAP